MAEHYFTRKPESTSRTAELAVELRGHRLRFLTDAGVFSRRDVDAGTRLLIDTMEPQSGQRILDLGCGYGPVGLAAAVLAGPDSSVLMVDVNERAVRLAEENAKRNGVHNVLAIVSDGFASVAGSFDWILTNPPIRVGKAVLYAWVEASPAYLRPGGTMLMVIRTKQGAKSMADQFARVFPETDTIAKREGYRVLLGRARASAGSESE